MACLTGLHLWRWTAQPKLLCGREKHQEVVVSKSGRCSGVNKTHLQIDQQQTLHPFSRATWKMALLKYCISHSQNNWASWQAFFSELDRKLGSAQLCGHMKSWGTCQRQDGLEQDSGGQSQPLHSLGHVGVGGREEKSGKSWTRTNWKPRSLLWFNHSFLEREHFFVLNLVASDFQDVAGSLDLSEACLFTRLLGQGQKDVRGNYSSGTQRETKGKARAFKRLLTHISHGNYNQLNRCHIFIAYFSIKVGFMKFPTFFP